MPDFQNVHTPTTEAFIKGRGGKKRSISVMTRQCQPPKSPERSQPKKRGNRK